MRIACVYAPQLALQAVLRRQPERWQQRTGAVALAAGPGDRARIVGHTAAAAAAGVERGMTVHQARAVTSAQLGERLQVEITSSTDTTAAQAALGDVGFGFAARIESEPERVFFDVSDLGSLFPAGEQAIVQNIAARADRVGLSVRVAIASSKAIARLASQARDLSLVPQARAEVAAYLGPLPISSLRLPDEAQERVRRWGVTTLGQLAALPLPEVALRLGEVGARAHRLASGDDDEPFAPQLPPDAVEEGTELDHAIDSLEPLSFVLRGLLDRALARLACRSLACAGLGLRLKLEPRGYDVRDVPLGAPCRESPTLLQLVRLDLARRPPAAAVVGVEVLALPARMRAVQLDFLRPAGPAPERLAATLARLCALVGPENVGAPAPVDDHRDELVKLLPWQRLAAPPEAPRPLPEAPDGCLTMRRYRPPHPLEVLMGRDGPTALRGPQLAARVLVAAGPYRADGHWWQDEGWNRDYWDVHASDGALYRLHQDRKTGDWFLDGYYD